MIKKKITFRLNAEVVKKLKVHCIKKGLKLSAFVEEIIKANLK